MGITRPQIQTMLQGIVDGDLSFDDYACTLGVDPPNVQIQLKAALVQRKLGGWTQEEYAQIRDEIRAEFDLSFHQQQKSLDTAPRMYNPFADVPATPEIPKDFPIQRLPSSMGKAEKRTGSAIDLRNPVRTKSGAFRPNVAEVWFFSPKTGEIKRRMFVSGKCIADAFAFANEIGAESAHEPAALIKFRNGHLKGNRHVLICTPDGYLATQQQIVEWHGQTRAKHKAPLGEKTRKLPLKVVAAMLAQNAELRKMFGTYTDQYGNQKLNCGLCLDIPTVEPRDSKELDYHVKFMSGSFRTIGARPKTDVKDEEGKVILAGHKRQAYTILLETEGEGADAPKSVRYEFKGKSYVVSRREALAWDREEEQEDPGMVALHAAFIDGHMTRDEYEERTSLHAETLAQAQWEHDNPGRKAAQARFKDELEWAKKEGIITEKSYEFMQGWNHPAFRERRGPTMWERKTRVQFYRNGRMVWQRAKNDDTPGARWVGNMNMHEAQIYNM